MTSFDDQTVRVDVKPGQQVVVASVSGGPRLSTSLSKSRLTATVTASGTWVTPTPTPIPDPPPTNRTSSPPLALTPADSGAIITDYDITRDSAAANYSFSIRGTAANPVKNITLVRPHFGGYWWGVLAEFVDGLTIIDPQGDTIGYCCFGLCSVKNFSIQRPVISQVYRPGPYPTTGGSVNNAYGVKLDHYVDNATVCDTGEVIDGHWDHASAMWQTLNAHSGRHIKFTGNDIAGSPRPIFVASDGLALDDFTIQGNTIHSRATVTGGASDSNGIAYGSMSNSVISGNVIDSTYNPHIACIDQYTKGPASTNVTVAPGQ